MDRSQITFGVLTIGQAPRVDRLGPELGQFLGDGVRIVERGALDDLSDSQIRGFAPAANRDPLVTLLRDGTSVRLDMNAILPLLQEKIAHLEGDDGVGATLLVCGGDFPTLCHRRPLIQPHNPVYGLVQGLVGEEPLAAMVPILEQVDPIRRGWKRFRDRDVYMVVADPYTRDALKQVSAASEDARRRGAAFLYMECFGYTLEMRDVARTSFQGPVLLARSLAGRILAELS
jgi:protein AroM